MHEPLPSSPRAARRPARGPRTAPRKALGQHFLADRNILARIVDAAEVGPQDTVVEVGAGQGTLTDVLAARAGHVYAIELDHDLAEALRRDLGRRDNVTVVEGDAREVDVEALLGGRAPYKVVGNLPYYAANPIVRRFLEASWKPVLLVVMVQMEVARQMAAPPGEMSLLSVGVQFYGRPRVVMRVAPGAFRPPPKVTSAVVRIDVYDRPPVEVEDEGAFFALVRAGFSAPRKHLRNPLAHGLGIAPAEAEALCAQAGVDPHRRAETLTLAEWAALARVWRRTAREHQGPGGAP